MIESFADRNVTCIQLANGSEWESCLRVDSRSDTDRAREWLEGFDGDYIGIEVFFSTPEFGDGESFAGVRLPFDESAVSLCLNLMGRLVDAASVLRISDFVAELRQFGPFFESGPDFMELGAVNMWNSFGPLHFWDSGSGDPVCALEDAISGAARFRAKLPAPAAIELAVKKPFPHWLGLVVSRRACDGYILRGCLLDKVTASLQSTLCPQ